MIQEEIWRSARCLRSDSNSRPAAKLFKLRSLQDKSGPKLCAGVTNEVPSGVQRDSDYPRGMQTSRR